MNCNDLRYIKTEEGLKKSLLKLLEQKKLDEISITGLCRYAKCSRNTFYQHYQTKDELYHAILSDMIAVIETGTTPLERDQSAMDEKKIRQFTYRFLSVIAEHRNAFVSLMSGNDMFLNFLSCSLYDAFMKHYQSLEKDIEIPLQGELMTRYFCCGIAAVIQSWLKDRSMTLQQAQRALDLCSRDNFRKMRDILIGQS